MSITLELFTALAVVQLLFFSANAVGSAATLAISPGTATVCGISASTVPRTILCTNISESVSTSLYPVYPNVSFDTVSAGTAFLCGLKSSRVVFYCWNGSRESFTRVYRGSWALSDLTVGETQVTAFDRLGNVIRWWRNALGLFPSLVLGSYGSLTSGNNFTCAIAANSTVNCWGPLGSDVQASFSDYSMTSIVAGDSHVCGLTGSGFAVCQGSNSSGQSYTPSGLPYEYTGFALGSSHTCAIRQPNGTAVCWGGSQGAHMYTPVNDTSFEFLVAGGNLTCGLTTKNYSVLCWGSDQINQSVRQLPLQRILPGICVAGHGAECTCGIYLDSRSLCNNAGVICRNCDLTNMIIPLPPRLSQSEGTGIGRKVSIILCSTFAMFFVFVGCGLYIKHKINKPRHFFVPPSDHPASDGEGISIGDSNPNPVRSRIDDDDAWFHDMMNAANLPLERQRSGPSTFRRHAHDS